MRSAPVPSFPAAVFAALLPALWVLAAPGAAAASNPPLSPAPTAALAADGGWLQIADPAAAGWSSAALASARQRAVELGSAAVLVVEDGRVAVAWGAVERPLRCASLRKSLVSLLYGRAVAAGAVDLDATLAELGVDDLGGLSATERRARLRDLLSARSGIYHPAAYEPAGMKQRRPERGSAAPGERWFYNNWDFNAAGAILERRLGRDLFAVFADELATPLGMEDFDLADTVRFLEPRRSRIPAHLFRLSARDLARVGQLVLQDGVWGGRQLVPRRWIAESTRAHTELPPDNLYGAGGYGYMWWLYPGDPGAASRFDRLDRIVARGNGGQVLVVAPQAGLVAVHRGDLDHGSGVRFPDAFDLLRRVVDAKRDRGSDTADGEAAGEKDGVALVPLQPDPFDHLPPPRPRRQGAPPAPDLRAALVGDYVVSPQLGFELYTHEGRLFAHPVGPPLADAELLEETDGAGAAADGEAVTLFSPVFDVTAEVARPAAGARVEEVRLTMNGRAMTARRRTPAGGETDGGETDGETRPHPAAAERSGAAVRTPPGDG
jgi:CubicO group peptidase (beta-lactamase class C family)